MIFNFKKRAPRPRHHDLVALSLLREGERAVIEAIELPEAVSDHLMNLGFLPGVEVAAGRCGLGGDPRVYRVDGAEVALRSETTRHMAVRMIGAEELKTV
jgi:ferrous iron transport protein A